MSSHSQKVPEAQIQPIPASSSNPALDKGAARKFEYHAACVYVAVAARHGVTASRLPWPRIGGSRERKKTSFFSSSPPQLPASLRPCLSALSLSGIFRRFSDLDFRTLLLARKSFDPARTFSGYETKLKAIGRRDNDRACAIAVVPTSQAETSPEDAIHQASMGA